MFAFILTAVAAIGRALALPPMPAPTQAQAEAGSPDPALAPAQAAASWTLGTPAWLLTAGWTAMGVALWVLFPMTAAVLLPLCTVAPLGWQWATRRRLPWYRPSPTTVALMLTAAFLLINATWSRSPDLAARAVTLFIVMVWTLHVVLNFLPNLEEPPRRAMAAGALAGLATAGVLLSLEIFSEQSVRRLLIHLIPALQPNPHHVAMEGGQLARLAPYLPNANIAVLTLMLWPAALLAHRLGLPRALRIAALAAATVAAATVLASEHASSQVALVGSGVVFALFWLRPKPAMRVLVAGWVAANLAVVPVAWLLYSADAHRAQWLPQSARQRVVIWRHTAAQIPKAPLLGAGIGTGRALHEMRQEGQVPLAPGTHFELSTNLHSHNAYLQVWFETGAVGAGMVLALGLAALWGLRALAIAAQPYLAATFAACALLVASAYSIWAPWFMATLAMSAIFAGLGAALRPPQPGPDDLAGSAGAGEPRSSE
jgi:exopolysaccharide production protein ExoQ